MDTQAVERELTTAEGLVKVILGAAAAYLAKRVVESNVEQTFRFYRR